MASREKFQKYDSPEKIRAAIRKMEIVMDGLEHRTLRASVFSAISGLKGVIKSLNFDKDRTDVLRKQQKQKDEKSRSSAKNAMEIWTDDADKLVLTSTLSDFEIGNEIGRSRNAVACRRKRLIKSKQVIL